MRLGHDRDHDPDVDPLELAPEMSLLEALTHLPFKEVMDVTEALPLSH